MFLWTLEDTYCPQYIEEMDKNIATYDETFDGNILVVGPTRSGKTSFVQNLGKNKMFDDIQTVEWNFLKIENINCVKPLTMHR